MRSIDSLAASYARNAPDAATPQGGTQIPTLGSLLGFDIRITEDAASNENTPKTGATIANMISRFQITDRNGTNVISVTGRQLQRLGDMLSGVGENQSAPAPGDGTAVSYARFFPLSIALADQPAILAIEWAPFSAMYSAGAAISALTFKMRGLYTRAEGVETLRIKAQTPPPISGENSLGAFLPNGELVDRLLILPNDAGVDPLSDSDITSFTLTHEAFNLINGANVADKFQPEDNEFRRDGHNGGTLLVRAPVFTVNATTQVTLDLSTNANFDMITVSRRPQQSR